MKAIVATAKEQIEVADVPIPDLKEKPAYVQVKVEYVALNPTDWKGFMNRDLPRSIIGCDFAGIVEEVGSDVKTKVAKGDRIAGMVHGSNQKYPGNGGFAEHALAKDGLFIKVPDSLSMQEASTLGVGITTVGQGLYQSLQLPWPATPAKEPFPVLIYGGSTATGTLAIQFAKLSGATVLATSSPRNFELLKSLGADAVFDYNDPSAPKAIRSYTQDGLHLVFDCIAEGNSLTFCAEALASDATPENHYSGLLGFKEFPRQDVKARFTMAYSVFGEPMDLGRGPMDAKPEDYEFGQKFWSLTQVLFEQGKLKVHPVDLRSGGLEAIGQGYVARLRSGKQNLTGCRLADLKDGKVSGKKVVYSL